MWTCWVMLWSHRLTETHDDTHTHTHTQWSGCTRSRFHCNKYWSTCAGGQTFPGRLMAPSLCRKLTCRTGLWHTRSSAEAAGRLAASLPARRDRACSWQLCRQPVTSAGSWSALRDGERSVCIMSWCVCAHTAWGGEEDALQPPSGQWWRHEQIQDQIVSLRCSSDGDCGRW